MNVYIAMKQLEWKEKMMVMLAIWQRISQLQVKAMKISMKWANHLTRKESNLE
jgi:hypothetical protein